MRRQQGFTLVEIAIVLVIIGLLLGGILRGQELIQGARVRNVIDQQNGVRAAYFAFQDRFRTIPGNLSAAQIVVVGNSVLAAGTNPGTGTISVNDSQVAFQNLTVTGFLSCAVCTGLPAGGGSTAANSPSNVYGGILQLATDLAYANGTVAAAVAPANRTSVKTGNVSPSNVMAEIDLKSDDGNPYTGNLRFSLWVAGGVGPAQANCAAGPTAAAAAWNNGQTVAPGGAIGANCGGATIF